MEPVKLVLFATLLAVIITCLYGATVLCGLVFGHQAAFYNGAGHMKDGTAIKASFEWGWFGRAVLASVVNPILELFSAFAVGALALMGLRAARGKRIRLPQQEPSLRWHPFRWHHKPQT